MNNDELMHYGRVGMKWYQNIYTKGKQARVRRKRKAALKKAREAREKQKTAAEQLANKKDMVLKSRSAKLLYENAHLFSQKELQSAYDRLNLERNIKNLIPEQVSKGKTFLNNYADWGSKINKATDETIKGYNNVAKVYNALLKTKGSDAAPLPKIDWSNEKKKDKKEKDD